MLEVGAFLSNEGCLNSPSLFSAPFLRLCDQKEALQKNHCGSSFHLVCEAGVPKAHINNPNVSILQRIEVETQQTNAVNHVHSFMYRAT